MKRILFLFLLITSCLQAFDISHIKSGDIIFRKTTEIMSDLFAQIDKTKYSHSGLVNIEDNKIFIYHMEDKGTSQDLQKESIDDFLNLASDFEIIRYKENINISDLNNILKEYISLNPKFDKNFNLNNGKENLYCTEFISNIYFQLIHKEIYTYKYKILNQEGITIKSILSNKDFYKI